MAMQNDPFGYYNMEAKRQQAEFEALEARFGPNVELNNEYCGYCDDKPLNQPMLTTDLDWQPCDKHRAFAEQHPAF